MECYYFAPGSFAIAFDLYDAHPTYTGFHETRS